MWRIGVNNRLLTDILTNSFTHIPSMSDRDVASILSKPGIYSYGIAEDQATSLDENEFLNFGIPRVQAKSVSGYSTESLQTAGTSSFSNEGPLMPPVHYPDYDSVDSDVLY